MSEHLAVDESLLLGLQADFLVQQLSITFTSVASCLTSIYILYIYIYIYSFLGGAHFVLRVVLKA